MAKVLIAVKAEKEMKLKLEYIAKRKSLGYPETVRAALLQYIEEYEQKNGTIKL